MKTPKTVAIIQARMGSSRLPGKVMMNMGGGSLLRYLTERLWCAHSLASIVIATTTEPQDDAIVVEARKIGVDCFRGSEENVLQRYVHVARVNNAEIVVRVTADNPFTDPVSIDRVVEAVQDGYDYAIEENLPVGTTGEALTFQALEFIDRVAFTSRWREHVTLYAKENRHMLSCAFLPPRPGCARPDLSYTVDRLDEYDYVRELCKKLPGPHFLLQDLIALADTPVMVYPDDRR